MPIVFACISPHPPIILPNVGSKKDREKVKKTIESLEKLGEKLKESNIELPKEAKTKKRFISSTPDSIIISAPHSDWGFNVPLFFLAKDFKGEIKTYLMSMESPTFYFEEGERVYRERVSAESVNYAVIASGDLSHCLKEDGPYGFNPDGPKFDKTLIESLKKKDINTILKLDQMFPEAGECGLRSICFMLGILETSGINYQPEVLSYEGPFGVGYLVANFKIKK